MLNVVYTLTNDFHKKALPSVRSLLTHNDAKIYVVTESDTVPFDAEVINVSEQKWFPKDGKNYGSVFTHMVLFKCVYPLLLDCDKVVHLDADTIVCDSLEPIWNIDLEGKWFGAVDEKCGPYHPFGEHYYNAGVMVMNLKEMRDSVPDMVEFLNTNKIGSWNRTR